MARPVLTHATHTHMCVVSCVSMRVRLFKLMGPCGGVGVHHPWIFRKFLPRPRIRNGMGYETIAALFIFLMNIYQWRRRRRRVVRSIRRLRLDGARCVSDREYRRFFYRLRLRRRMCHDMPPILSSKKYWLSVHCHMSLRE